MIKRLVFLLLLCVLASSSVTPAFAQGVELAGKSKLQKGTELVETIPSSPTVTLLTLSNCTAANGPGGASGGGCYASGSSEIGTSGSWTPLHTGDEIVLITAYNNQPTFTVSATGYTWSSLSPIYNSGSNISVQLFYATAPNTSAATFATSGLAYNTINYATYDITSTNNTQDQSGTALALAATTSGSTAVAHEAGICATGNGYALGGTPESGWTALSEITNAISTSLKLDADYLNDTGATGSVTGCFSAGNSGGPASQIITFEP